MDFHLVMFVKIFFRINKFVSMTRTFFFTNGQNNFRNKIPFLQITTDVANKLFDFPYNVHGAQTIAHHA